MDLLITVIGNAVLDPVFREHLVDNPIQALDDWGFRLTKSEIGYLRGMFTGGNKDELKNKLATVGELLYRNHELLLEQASTMKMTAFMDCPTRRCCVTAYPLLPELREELRRVAAREANLAPVR